MIRPPRIGQWHRKAKWASLGDFGRQWRLLSFSARQPPTFHQYLLDQREYWGADNPDQQRLKLYFGDTNTEENFLTKTKAGYESYCRHLEAWCGVLRPNDIVQVVVLSPSTLVLSHNWLGEVQDHVDLILELEREVRFFVVPSRFRCEIRTLGTVTVPKGSIMEQMGERAGSSRISNKAANFFGTEDDTVNYYPHEQRIQVHDARFLVLANSDA